MLPRPPDRDVTDPDAPLAAAREGPARLLAALPSDPDARADRLRAVRDRAEAAPASVADALAGLAALFDDEADAVRLLTAKTFLAVSEADPESVPTDPLREALDDEFYYVRARAAQALGRVARATGEADPALVARLLNGLTLEREESRERYAGALADVSLGAPDALRTVSADLADSLGDEGVRVRYHLATALAALAIAHPGRTEAVADRLRERVDDEDPYVAGRAAEALGYAGVDCDPSAWRGDAADGAGAFAADRAAFARAPDPATRERLVAELRADHDSVAERVGVPDDPDGPPGLPPGLGPDGPSGPGGPGGPF
jgi:HEAT repeat protein